MRIDGHQHFWDPAERNYAWMPAGSPLDRAFGPADVAPILDAGSIAGTVLVQASPDESETDALLAIARASPQILGVVGWIDLAADDAPARIAARAADPLIIGVRPMLQDMVDRAWILSHRLEPALRAIAETGIVFDALVHADQIPHITAFAAQQPDIAIVLDHC